MPVRLVQIMNLLSYHKVNLAQASCMSDRQLLELEGIDDGTLKLLRVFIAGGVIAVDEME